MQRAYKLKENEKIQNFQCLLWSDNLEAFNQALQARFGILSKPLRVYLRGRILESRDNFRVRYERQPAFLLRLSVWNNVSSFLSMSFFPVARLRVIESKAYGLESMQWMGIKDQLNPEQSSNPITPTKQYSPARFRITFMSSQQVCLFLYNLDSS